MPVYGNCTKCGCIEVRLTNPEGVQDLSSIGEDPEYPFGFGCEVCEHQPNGWTSATAPVNFQAGTKYIDLINARK